MTPFEYWATGAGLSNVTPKGKAWPEGEDFSGFLSALMGERRILEFGCGPGRLAAVLDPSRYIGVDICAAAIEQARKSCPDHEFRLIDQDEELPETEAVLCHTVLLHIPDDDLAKTINRFRAPIVFVSEILGRGWRRSGDPPVFNRDQADYEQAFAAADYTLAGVRRRPYPHYYETDLTILEFRHGPVLDAPRAARPRRTRGRWPNP